MKNFDKLEPKRVWAIFREICSIGHPSGHEEKLAAAIAGRAEERGLAVRRDSAGNLRIDRPAAPGFENAPAVLLQAHLDMVPQAAPGVAFDFLNDPIPPVVKEGWVVSAAGTTLGADDGIGVAAALALLFDADFRCGPIAVLLTVSEEVGLNGAQALPKAFLAGKFLLNLDSEEEGELCVGCAGGARLTLTFDAAWGADQTVKIMEAVEKYGFKCTFFLTGFWIDENPELVKEIASRGHLIGNHSESHKHLNEVADLNAEIDAVNAEINTLTGASPKYFRAPFGEYDNNMMSTLESKGMQGVQWSIDSLDWKGLSAAEIAERVVNDLEPGDIVLMHNASDHIVEALPLILLSIHNKGLTAVRLDEMLYSENYTVNSQGIQIQNQ